MRPAKNFKKKQMTGATQINPLPKDKFSQLREKIQQQKSMQSMFYGRMRQSGRRFRQTDKEKQSLSNHKTQTVNISSIQKLNEASTSMTEKKKEISLTELSQTNNYTPDLMKSSKVLEKGIEQEKKRGLELITFLKSHNLQSFYQGFIQNGYQDLSTLAEITTEELNHLMMRAQHQDRLLNALKSYRTQLASQDNSLIFDNQTQFIHKTKTRPKSAAITTNPSTPSQSRTLKQGQNIISSKSFLYSVGSYQWSIESQVRRACSGCYKVTPQIVKKDNCYYCQDCYKWVSEDCLSISLNNSMVRNYHDI